jgi:hypothetical protein
MGATESDGALARIGRTHDDTLLDLTAVVSLILSAHAPSTRMIMTTVPLSDEEFLRAFLECRLTPEQFDHRAHVRAAWLLLNRHSMEHAIEHMCSGILALAIRFGAREKYNRTLSEAVMRLMAADASVHASWDEFLRSQPRLLGGVRTLLAEHYSPDRLHSPAAKEQFVAPDRSPLPSCRL